MKCDLRRWAAVGTVLLLAFSALGWHDVAYSESVDIGQAPQGQPSAAKDRPKGSPTRDKYRKIFEEIYARRNTLEKSADYLKEAYQSLKIRNLRDIPRDDYKSYEKYLYNKNAYIIVHPAYYLFFENTSKTPPREFIGTFPVGTLLDRFAGSLPPDAMNLKALVAQSRILEDFLELFSTEKRLVILILPKDYRKHLSYGYVEGQDEYARYLNEITNMSESVLYLESADWSNGFLEKNDLETLTAFLTEVGAKNILLGGGYLGKCIDNFYETVRKKFRYEDVYFVMELSALAPYDMVTGVLEPNGRINFGEMRNLLDFFGVSLSSGEEKPRFKRITSYPIYR